MKNENPGKINRTQLLNIVAFCALMQNNGGLLGDKHHAGKSPTYILEKFHKYALQTDIAYHWGLDSERQRIVREWAEKWVMTGDERKLMSLLKGEDATKKAERILNEKSEDIPA